MGKFDAGSLVYWADKNSFDYRKYVVNFGIVDYENMGNIKKLVSIDGYYIFFIGSTQTSIPKSLVLATNNIKVEWVAIEGSGKNALDFHIAYFLGKKDLEADTLHFILSKDTG